MLHSVTVFDAHDQPVLLQVPSLVVPVRDVQLALAAAWKPKVDTNETDFVR